MALTVFRSKAAGEIFMQPDNARRLFEIIGRELSARGVIAAADLPAALAKLEAAVDAEKAAVAAARAQEDAAEARGDAPARAISLGQRAFPLMDMMRAAIKRNVDVTWGI